MNSNKEKLIKTFCKVRKHRSNNNLVVYKKTGFVKCKFVFKGKQNKIQANESIFYKCKFHFFGSNNSILIGSNCIFKNVDFWIEGDNNSIIIGDFCSFCGSAQIACLEGTKVEIGDNALCSSDVCFRTSDSHAILDLSGKRTNTAKNIRIGSHVWICQKVSILKGSCVSDNCVVALGSVLTKQINECNCVIGGNPAKILKRDIKWTKERE